MALGWRRSAEHRAASTINYTSEAIAKALERASDRQGFNHESGWQSIATSLYAAAFEQAEATGLDGIDLDLSIVAADFMRGGESVWAIDVRDGAIALTPASHCEVQGSPTDWTYRLTLTGPSTSIDVTKPPASVLHMIWQRDSKRPWQGRSPARQAPTAARLATSIENSLAQEARTSVGYVTSLAGIGGDIQGQKWTLQDVQEWARGLKGKLAVIWSNRQWQTVGQYGDRTPVNDWQVSRFGPNPPQSVIELYDRAMDRMLDVARIPSPLVRQNEGAAQREAWRRFVVNAVEPALKNVARECSFKLDREVSFSTRALKAMDSSNQARAVGSLVQAGSSLADAMMMVYGNNDAEPM